jgi:hypothetical protein
MFDATADVFSIALSVLRRWKCAVQRRDPALRKTRSGHPIRVLRALWGYCPC